MNKLTQELIEEINSLSLQDKTNFRFGQAVFNCAYKLYPKEVGLLTTTDFDCFHDNNKVFIFIDELNKQLKE
jgi:hypothetical protein